MWVGKEIQEVLWGGDGALMPDAWLWRVAQVVRWLFESDFR
jgi:hypothetical protein